MGGCLQEMVTKVTRGLLGQGDKVTRRLGGRRDTEQGEKAAGGEEPCLAGEKGREVRICNQPAPV